MILAAGLAIGLGTYSGGWRIMRTMGKGIVEIETPQGAAAGAATARPSSRRPTSASACPPPTSAPAASSAPGSAARAPRSAGASPAGCWSPGCSPCPAPVWSAAWPRCSPITAIVGVIALLVLLGAACLVIYLLSRRNRINHPNVTDSHEVLVLAAAAPPTTYANDPRLDPLKPKKQEGQEAQSEERA